MNAAMSVAVSVGIRVLIALSSARARRSADLNRTISVGISAARSMRSGTSITPRSTMCSLPIATPLEALMPCKETVMVASSLAFPEAGVDQRP